MVSRSQLADFLAGVERRAFKQAVFAVRDEDAALDIVQDSMMRLAESYGDHPAEELPLLFQRILQNAIRDFFRRSRVRMEYFLPLALLDGADDEEGDPLETIATEAAAASFPDPEASLWRSQTVEAVEEALKNLPARQREAFLLRYWEGFDIAETAALMGCSEGSVKTHCSRATHALAAALGAKGIQP